MPEVLMDPSLLRFIIIFLMAIAVILGLYLDRISVHVKRIADTLDKYTRVDDDGGGRKVKIPISTPDKPKNSIGTKLVYLKDWKKK
jgi:hypothetical protein